MGPSVMTCSRLELWKVFSHWFAVIVIRCDSYVNMEVWFETSLVMVLQSFVFLLLLDLLPLFFWEKILLLITNHCKVKFVAMLLIMILPYFLTLIRWSAFLCKPVWIEAAKHMRFLNICLTFKHLPVFESLPPSIRLNPNPFERKIDIFGCYYVQYK